MNYTKIQRYDGKIEIKADVGNNRTVILVSEHDFNIDNFGMMEFTIRNIYKDGRILTELPQLSICSITNLKDYLTLASMLVVHGGSMLKISPTGE